MTLALQPKAAVLGHQETTVGDHDDHCLQEDVPQERSRLQQNSEESDETVVHFAPGLLAQQVTDFISKMEAVRPELVRAARVQSVLQGLARPLRVKGDFYNLGQAAKPEVFWSHSWHGSVPAKVATVFFLHNATAATAVSTGAAALTCIAFGLGALPDDDHHSWWCLSSGCFAYLLTMFFWRPRQLVFVDRICISQVDSLLQAQGIFSLGAILKSADVMLVLWDPSWARRLWCVWELAAFIHSRPNGEKPRVSVRPTMLGFTMSASWFAFLLGGVAFHVAFHTIGVDSGRNGASLLFISLACCGVIFWYIAHLAREYCRHVTTMGQHIGHFRVAGAEAFCCSIEHRRPGSDEPVMCDREVMQKCITIWFGSIESFEQCVQGEVCDLMVNQLSHQMVSYWRLAEASPIVFWTILDRVAYHLRYMWHSGDTTPFHIFGSLRILVGLSFWLGVVPILFRIMFLLAWIMQARCACRLLDAFMSLLLVLAGLIIFSCFVFLDYLLVNLFAASGLDALAFTLITGPIAALAWYCLPVPVPRLSRKTATSAAATAKV